MCYGFSQKVLRLEYKVTVILGEFLIRITHPPLNDLHWNMPV